MSSAFFSALIIDAKSCVRMQVKSHLKRHFFIKIIGMVDSTEAAQNIIANNLPDIVFIDIEIARRNEFKFVREIQRIITKPLIVFLADYDQYALLAIKNYAFDYIFKPIAQYEFDSVLEKLKEKLAERVGLNGAIGLYNQSRIPNKIRFNQKRMTIFVNVDEIIYCKANGSYTEIFIDENHSEVVTHNLKDVAKQLDDNFERLGRSLIINKRYLSKVDRINHRVIFEKQHRMFSIPVSSKLVRLI